MSADDPTASETAATTPTGVTALTLAGWASLGAGAIHAAAIGVHADARQPALAFTAVAIFQLGWGAVALAVQHRLVALVGAAGSALLVAGWVMTQTSGIWFVDGLDVATSAQLTDTLAALLAGAAALLSLSSAIGDARATWRPIGRLTTVVGMIVVVGLTVPGLVGASDHDHDHGAVDHDHDDAAQHDDAAHDDVGHHDDGDDRAPAADAVADHRDDHQSPAPKPYDPDLPIDLGGVDGVTPQQQAAAENLIAVTLLRLPQFSDPAAAEAAGFRSIGDGVTGHEHYINWSHIADGRILDPDYPESLVYEMRNGQKTLVAAMYMLERGATLDDVPELGGPLTQWHIHDNLCFTADPEAPLVRGLTDAEGNCNPPLVKGAQVPMIHVWIVPHECGPFAALDGVGGGQIAEGEERLCDHAHGA